MHLSATLLFDFLSRDFILKFLKFGAVGFSGVFVDFGITYLCKEKLRIYKYLSNAMGFTCAVVSNYFLNRVWTFHSHNPQVAVEFSKFLLISLVGLGINSLVLWTLVSRFKKHFYLSKLFAIGVTTIWNFFANVLITFH